MEEKASLKRKIKSSLRLSILDGVAAGVTLGVMENFIRPLAIALGASNIQIGVLSSLPHLFSSLAQLKTADLAEWLGSRKRVIVPTVFLHALVFLPIAMTVFLPREPAIQLLIIGYTLCMVFASFASPAWGSMMSELVPLRRRGAYFGKRERVFGFVSVLSALLAGVFLHWKGAQALSGFFVIFLVAGISRLVSCYLLSRIYEKPLRVDKGHYFSFSDFLKRIPQGNFGRYVTFVTAINFAAHMSAPFFSVFMLRDLEFSYLKYALILTVGDAVSLVSKTLWGRYSDRVGNIKVLRICSAIIPLLPVLWIFSQDIYYLLFIQVLAGAAWGGFNLCSVNFVYESAIPEKRTRCISYYNTTNGIAIFAGTMVGGLLATHLPHLAGNRILALFLLSGVLRALAGLLLLTRVKEVRHVEAAPKEVAMGQKALIPRLHPGLEEGVGG